MKNSNNKSIDLLIAGQGAAGYAAGLYAARYQIKTILVGQEFGGETAIGGIIENYPGNAEIDGFDSTMFTHIVGLTGFVISTFLVFLITKHIYSYTSNSLGISNPKMFIKHANKNRS